MPLPPSLALLVLALATAQSGNHVVYISLKMLHCEGVFDVDTIWPRYGVLFFCIVKACTLRSDLLLQLGLWPFIPFTCRCFVQFVKLLGTQPTSGPLDSYLLVGLRRCQRLCLLFTWQCAKITILTYSVVEGCPSAVVCWSWKCCPWTNSLLWQMKSWK